jgi:hypothetical protein
MALAAQNHHHGISFTAVGEEWKSTIIAAVKAIGLEVEDEK